jgi:8-oxo-dGTP pyrophosphatase MutT (NUDIX family)
MSTDERRHGGGGAVLNEVSFGGVAVRYDEAARRHEVLVITPRGTRVTGLPKGGANEGETEQQTAGREVREETGINVDVGPRLGDVRYWYRRQGRRVHKTVHFYLCEFVSGSTADHDHEVDDARWIAADEARTALTYPGEREMLERALSKLRTER